MVLFKLNSDVSVTVLLALPRVVVSLRKFFWIWLDDAFCK